MHRGCGFDPPSGHMQMQEAASECVDVRNNKSVSLALKSINKNSL